MHASNPSQNEKLNYIAAAIISAAGIHVMLSALALPGIFALPAAGMAEIAMKAAKIAWTLAGVAGGAFVAFQALSIIQGRSFRKGRLAAMGALALPLLGVSGPITAWPLLPVGIIALALLHSPGWKEAFADSWQDDAALTAQS
jgi:hypothetical protein